MSAGKGKIAIKAMKPSPQELEEFLRWILTQEEDVNPATDDTGERAGRNQGKSDTWFIAGSVGKSGPFIRKCRVPADSDILIPLATSDFSDSEYEAWLKDKGIEPEKAEVLKAEVLKDVSRKIADLHKDMVLKISTEGESSSFEVKDASTGKPGDLELVETDVFPINISVKNVYSSQYKVKAGFTRMVGCGWAIKVRLAPGEYKLTMKAQHGSDKIKIGSQTFDINAFSLDIQYDLTAIPDIKDLKFAVKYSA